MPVQCLLSKCGGLILRPVQKRLFKAAVRCGLPASSCSDSRGSSPKKAALCSRVVQGSVPCAAALLCWASSLSSLCRHKGSEELLLEMASVALKTMWSLNSHTAHKAVWCLSLEENGSSEWRPFQDHLSFFQRVSSV